MSASTPSNRAEIVTFGCRLNTYESEVMRDLTRGAGLGDTVIVNTCAVTAEAERQARQAIRRLRRERPGARIVVTGCAAQIAPERFASMDEVDRVVGNGVKLDADTWRADRTEPVTHVPTAELRETAGHLVTGFEGRVRGFVQVQNGCDHGCTFCIIPQGRGPSRSVPIGAVVGQVRALVSNGYREVVLTGVDVTSYGHDLPGRPRLGQMVRRLLAQVPELPRLRLSSLDPAEVDADLMRMIAEEPRLMPHLHLSLQAGNDLILKRMKRRHSRADAIRFCADVRALRPEVAFGADLIAGFPTETEAQFADTMALVDDCDLTHLHVFPYSAREGTPAARMPQVAKPARKARAAALRDAGQRALARFLDAQLGGEAEVLVESTADGAGIGHTERFARVQVSGAATPARTVRARLLFRRDDLLLAEAA